MAVQSMFWGLPITSWDKIGFWLLVAGAGLGVAALFSSLASSIILYRVGNATQSVLQAKTEELRAANLALEVQIAPRRLNSAPMDSVVAPIAPFAGKKVRLASYALDVEGAVLALRIKEVLDAAGIEVDTVGASGVLPMGKIAFGVFVDGPDRKLVTALVTALSPVNAAAQPIPHMIGDTDAAATVFVAAKPPIQ